MNYKMLEYHRVYITEAIDVDQVYPSKECDICHY